ncbi:hypothetical protein GQ457_05G018560 [Hibiscus cannabinus]
MSNNSHHLVSHPSFIFFLSLSLSLSRWLPWGEKKRFSSSNIKPLELDSRWKIMESVHYSGFGSDRVTSKRMIFKLGVSINKSSSSRENYVRDDM